MTMIMSIPRAKAVELLAFCKENNLETFFAAKDHGAYIGATAGKDATFKRCICYVAGCNPDTDPDFYENAHYKYGGDDFGVPDLPVKWLELFTTHPKLANKRTFGLKFSSKSVSIVI